jgi:hypothetical protein
MRQLGDGSLSRRLLFRADVRSRAGWSRWPAFDFKDASKPNCVIGPSRQPQQVREPIWRRRFCSACLSDGHHGPLQASMVFLLSECETFRVIHQYDGPNAAKGSFRRRSARSSRRRERDWPCKEPRERSQRIFAVFFDGRFLTAGHPCSAAFRRCFGNDGWGCCTPMSIWPMLWVSGLT